MPSAHPRPWNPTRAKSFSPGGDGHHRQDSVAGSVLDVEMAILDKQSKGVPIDEQANDDVVHLYRLREADRLAD
jgi:hypothetical protein